MNGINDRDQAGAPRRPIGFCQSCGRALDGESVRRVGAAVYCEPCLEMRLGAAAPPPPGGDPVADPAAAGYRPVNMGAPPKAGAPADTVWQWGAGMPSGWTPGSGPNPGIAALLGLIPGVGAMYNEQYAKGIVHLLIFAVLVLMSHAAGIFGLFVMGWVFYMAIEAHHTAKARRDGTPLPNPFGFNDIGERMGFGKGWPNGPDVANAARDAVEAAAAGINAAAAGFNSARPRTSTGAAAASGASTGAWGAPADAYSPPSSVPPGSVPPSAAYGTTAGQPYAYATPPYGAPYSAPYSGPYVPPVVVPPVASPHRFPVGAVLLIGFGMLFLLSTMGLLNAVPGSAMLGLALLAMGGRIAFRRLNDGSLNAYKGTAGYELGVLRALRGAVWMVAIGVLFLLVSFHLVSWDYSWPWLIILGGVMMLVQRAAKNAASAATVYPPQAPPPHRHAEPVVSAAAASDPASRVYVTPAPGSSSDANEGGL